MAAQPRTSQERIVVESFAAFRDQDRAAAERLYADDLVFTSPQDDHLDRTTWFERCFPTAGHFVSQEILRLATVGPDVFVLYEYELATGTRHRNAEVITVRDGRISEVQVFFGGRYDS